MALVLTNPNFDETYNFLANNVYKKLVTVFADCEIQYSGRATSYASLASRLIIIKVDGSVIVHEHTKREPINWQPPGSIISIRKESGVVGIESIRKRPKERLYIILRRVYYLTSAEVNSGEFNLKGTEKDLVEIVLEKPNLVEDGFKPLQREYRTPYGIVDLLGYDKIGRPFVLEFKRSKATLQAVSQLYRYYMFFIEQYGNARGALVSPGISEKALNLLNKLGLEYIDANRILNSITNSSKPIINLSNIKGN
ncbi:endonuclease NucS [Sulfurisphaera javensis]|uniref:Endonuclease NucS n=1 Tax=Sulfurisphaera javensis TaxID=2049879 RepID=A0AAT9GPI4_9CREN